MFGDHRDLHVLTHSFPTRTSSDLDDRVAGERAVWTAAGVGALAVNAGDPQARAVAIHLAGHRRGPSAGPGRLIRQGSAERPPGVPGGDRKSTRLNSSH